MYLQCISRCSENHIFCAQSTILKKEKTTKNNFFKYNCH